MQSGFIDNRATETPFAGILCDLLSQNLAQHPDKWDVFMKMQGSAAIDLADIETAVTLVFAGGTLRIEAGIVGQPGIVIRTDSERVMDLNGLHIIGGLPWYFDEAGRKVVGHLLAGRLRIKGMFTHPVLLNRLTVVMSVM